MKHAAILAAICLLGVAGPVVSGDRFELGVGGQTPVSRAVLAETRSIIAARLRAAGVAGSVAVDPPSRLSVSLVDKLPKRFVDLLTAPGRIVFRIVPYGPTYRVPGGRRALRSATAAYTTYGGVPVINFKTTDPASFLHFTTAHLRHDCGIFVDGHLLASPVLVGAISDSGQITGDFTVEETLYYAAMIGFAPLPAPVRVVGR